MMAAIGAQELEKLEGFVFHSPLTDLSAAQMNFLSQIEIKKHLKIYR